MKYKVKIIALSALLFSINSCTNDCDHSNCAKEIVKEEVILKEQTQFNGKPKNIIFMIGDGMGIAQIYAGFTRNKGYLNLSRCKHIGFSKTNSADNYITDSAAGATAFSTGKKTYNGAIGIDKDSVAQKTILEIAEEKGLSTGLVATAAITHATPASFIAHQPSRKMGEEIASDFLKTDIDVFIGGGKMHFTDRKDGDNLTTKLSSNGYTMAYTLEDVESYEGNKLAALLADDGMAKMSEGRGHMLEKSSLKAIEIVDKNDSGFFLMIEGSQIDWGGHENNSEYIINEMVDFDNVVGKVLDWADKDGETLVVITADHETGGYALTGGNLETGEVEGKFSTDYHTSVMVPVFAYGPGADAFMGMYENTSFFTKFMNLFGFGE